MQICDILIKKRNSANFAECVERYFMKKYFKALLIAGLIALIAACSPQPKEYALPEKPTYTVTNRNYSEDYHKDDVKIASYSFTVPEIASSNSEDDDMCAQFNMFFKEYAEKLIEGFKSDVYSLALDDYSANAEKWGDKFYSDNVSFSYVKTENYLGIVFDSYTNVGGDVPVSGTAFYMYDLENGKFFTYKDLSDDVEGFKEAIAQDLLTQLMEQGGENLSADYESKVRNLENVQMYFCEEGVIVVIPRVALNPKNIGAQQLLLDYSVVEPYLNDYALEMFFEYTGTVG